MNIRIIVLLIANCLYNYMIFNLIQLCGYAPDFTYAYLDPSTGSMIISAIIGVFATIVLGFKTCWYKITSLFRKKNKNNS